MTLVDRLRKRAKELDGRVFGGGGYNQQVADDRELLEEAAKVLSAAPALIDMAYYDREDWNKNERHY